MRTRTDPDFGWLVDEGECRKNAPQVVTYSGGLFTENSKHTVFPKVSKNDWCGEYKHQTKDIVSSSSNDERLDD